MTAESRGGTVADLDLDAMAERAAAVTQGPWDADAIDDLNTIAERVEQARLRDAGINWSRAYEEDVPRLLAEVRRMAAAYDAQVRHGRAHLERAERAEAERDNLARWKAEARVVLNAFYDLAERVVPDSALGRFLPDVLAEHVDRQEAALRSLNEQFAAMAENEARAVTDAARAEAALREVGALHRSVFYDGVEWCTECVSADEGGPVPWPCSTARILARHSGGESEEPVRHIGGEANAEDCPACRAGDGGPLPYPFICPGEPAGADRSEASDG